MSGMNEPVTVTRFPDGTYRRLVLETKLEGDKVVLIAKWVVVPSVKEVNHLR
jgi:hypothetical protein